MPEKGERPQVTETDYVSTTDGPAEDTGTFYKGTPAPGVRSDFREPRPPPSAAREPERLQLRKKSNPDVAAPSAGDAAGIPWLWVAGGVGTVALIGLLAALVLILAFSLGGGGDEPAPEEDKTWEGLKVKKGLR